MKRFHVHVSVADVRASVAFYSALFQSAPTLSKDDYAKWELDDPRVHFAVSSKPDRLPGLNHLGIQVTERAELDGLYAALGAANITTRGQVGARCCYAESDKHWAVDPTGIVWETYHTMDRIAVYGEDRAEDLDPRSRNKNEGKSGGGCGTAPKNCAS